MEQKDDTNKVANYKCKFCRKFCFSMVEVEEHEKTHVVNKKLLCRVCGMGFARRSYLAEHMVIHAGIQPHKCPHCPKLFSLRCNLVRHVRIHTGEKPFKCTICEQSFTLKKNMIEHVRTHTGERPYQCPQCDIGFSRRSSLVRHARTHTGERSFQCHHCGKKFSWKYYLRRHVSTHLKRKEHVVRKRRTKAEIARDKAAKESSCLVPVVSIPKLVTEIKIEQENEGTTCQVFLPTPVSDHNYEYEGTEDIKEEVPDEPLKTCRVVLPNKHLEVEIIKITNKEEKNDEVEFEPVKIKEEIIEEDNEISTSQNEICHENSEESDSSDLIILYGGRKVSKENYNAIKKRRLIVDIPKV